MNRRTGKHWSYGITDDMPVKEQRLQKAPACFGNPGAGVLCGNTAGGGQVWKECRSWILSFPGLNLGSVCCGCVTLGKLSDCSVPPQETLYSLQVCERSQQSQRQSQAPVYLLTGVVTTISGPSNRVPLIFHATRPDVTQAGLQAASVKDQKEKRQD